MFARPVKGEPLSLGRNQPFDFDWRFYRGAGENFEVPSCDESEWRKLDLPHDWSIEDVPGVETSGVETSGEASPDILGPFDKSAEAGADTGFTLGGEGWYRKRFYLADLPESGQVQIQFEGISVVSDVWLNGAHLGTHVHGYTPFAHDLTPHIRRGAENIIAIRVRNIGHNSRWYAGSGIYRPVTINVLPESACIARWGVAAWTRKIEDGVAEIDVTTRLVSPGAGLILASRLTDPAGNIVAEIESPADAEVKQTLKVDAPRLWSPGDPHLYVLETVLRRGEQVIDGTREPFGIRIVNIDAGQGLRINGDGVILRGGCIHHDNGLLGAAAYADAEERKVLLLKARGFNALRSAHNPSSQALRYACDRHGMLLIEESFDMWQAAKLPDDYSNYFAGDWRNAIHAMVLSGRNSPSVIMWSIGNEIPQRSTPAGVEWSWRLANEVRRLDPTRPVTAAINGTPGRPVVAEEGTARQDQAGKADYASSVFLDVVGYNYRLDDFVQDHAFREDRVFYGSETYPREAYDYRVLTESAPYVIGEFVWTAMDYLGEAGIGLTQRLPADNARPVRHEFPVVGAFCGDIDLIGAQKPQSLARDVIWGLSHLEMTVGRPLAENEVEVVPHWGWPEELSSWTWPGAEGVPIKVRVYASGDTIVLRLNGSEIARRALTPGDKMYAEFQVPYAPGELEALAYRDGQEIGRRQLQTVSEASALRLTPEKIEGNPHRQSLHYVLLEVVDAGGRVLPDGERTVRVDIHGPAELVGFGSANPRAEGSCQSGEARTYQGKALLILRSTGQSGSFRILASSDGISDAATTINLG